VLLASLPRRGETKNPKEFLAAGAARGITNLALVTDPWVVSRCGSAGEGRAEPAEVEHGEGDERFW